MKPIEHHLDGWHHHAHNHETGKKKMLGGVSFDGGGAAGVIKGNALHRAGVQMAQPSSSDTWGIGMGIGTEGLRPAQKGMDGRAKGTDKKKGDIEKKADINRRQKDTVSIRGTRDKTQMAENMERAVENQIAAGRMLSDVNRAADAAGGAPAKKKRRDRIDYKKYIGKIQNGIQSFLKGRKQKAGKENSGQPKKREPTGTRTVTKEEVYEIQINTAYLLDSYNKYGERSTLGKE